MKLIWLYKITRTTYKLIEFAINDISPRFDADISLSMTGKTTEAGEKYRIFGEWINDYLPAVEPGLLQKETPSVSIMDSIHNNNDNQKDAENNEYSTEQLEDSVSLILTRLALN